MVVFVVLGVVAVVVRWWSCGDDGEDVVQGSWWW